MLNAAGNAGTFAAKSVGALQVVIAGTIFTAQTGVNYRKFKKGMISKKEFKQRTRKNGVRQTGSVVGGSVGAGTGFLVG